MILRFLFLLFVSTTHAEIVLCIDGGGSKTALQAIDENGAVLMLEKNGVIAEEIRSEGSNINIVGKEGVRQAIATLIDETYIDDHEIRQVISECQIYACFAGIGVSANQRQIESLFEEFGCDPAKLHVLTDAEMPLELIQGDGAILICGTGSICLGKKAGRTYQVGGLGRIIGDEGSGYQIGLHAIKACLEEEYGWGKPTRLTAEMKKLFNISQLKELIKPVNSGQMAPGTIAKAVPLVFEQAFTYNDPIAKGILLHAENELSAILQTMVQMADLKNCEIHLWGGVFKNAHIDSVVQNLSKKVSDRNITLINQSSKNVALLYALSKLG